MVYANARIATNRKVCAFAMLLFPLWLYFVWANQALFSNLQATLGLVIYPVLILSFTLFYVYEKKMIHRVEVTEDFVGIKRRSETSNIGFKEISEVQCIGHAERPLIIHLVGVNHKRLDSIPCRSFNHRFVEAAELYVNLQERV